MIPILPANGGGFRPVIPATGQLAPIFSYPGTVRPVPITPILRPVAPGAPVAKPVLPSPGFGEGGATTGTVAQPQPVFATASTPVSTPTSTQNTPLNSSVITGSENTGVSSTQPQETPTVNTDTGTAVGTVGRLSPWLLVAGAALVLLLILRR